MSAPGKNYPVEDDKPPPKILFLGDDNVGKSTFIRRYCEHMINYYECDYYQDLPTGTTAESRSGQYPSSVSLGVLCYAVDSLVSFANVWERWLPEFREHYPNTPCYLLGLKCDMRLEMLAANKTPVNTERARLIHQREGFDGVYLECSVEGNPEYAIRCMGDYINDVFIYDPNL